MDFGSLPQSGGGARSPARTFAWFCAIFLLLQGASTLAARLVPAVDRAFPQLLALTRMVPKHSLLHIATALLAGCALALGARGVRWFAALFGIFYAGIGALGVMGAIVLPDTGSGAQDLCGLTAGLGLQTFDHPFHLLLGLLGIVAAWRTPPLASLEAGGPSPTPPIHSPEKP